MNGSTGALWRVSLFGGLRADPGPGLLELGLSPPPRPVTRFATRKAGALLSYLALHPERPEPRESLAHRFWPDATGELARHSLRVAVSSLRRLLEPAGVGGGAFLVAAAHGVGARAGIRIAPGAVTTDLSEFRAALAAADAAVDEADRIRLLEHAVALPSGPLLPAQYDEWALTEQESARAELYAALRELARLLAAPERAPADLSRALGCLRRAIELVRLRVEAHADLIRLHAAAGQTAGALRHYHELEALFRRELDAVPLSSTRSLAVALREAPEAALQSPRAPGAVPPAAAVARSRPDLPAPLTRFIGRGRELAQLRDMLGSGPPPVPHAGVGNGQRRGGASDEWAGGGAEQWTSARVDVPAAPGRRRASTPPVVRSSSPPLVHSTAEPHLDRLVTIIGPGGTGKTRLAIEAARECASHAAGVWFVPLADVAHATFIGQRILRALGENATVENSFGPTVVEAIAKVLDAEPVGRLILVLDNFEHLTGSGTEIVRALMGRIPRLSCLITSWQRLDLRGERELPLAPLPTPTASPRMTRVESLLSCESVQLFLDRARAVRPEFGITPGNAAAVAALCHFLEGIPLAIELAATRAHVLTPEQMLAQLAPEPGRHGSRRLDFLVSRERDVEARHRTLRAALAAGRVRDPDRVALVALPAAAAR